MLVSELKGWHWLITWDNPKPADSRSMIAALSKLGKLTAVKTKTTYLLAPKSTANWQAIRRAIKGNLNSSNGSAVYVNLKSGLIFECSIHTKFLWKKAN